MRNLKLKHHQDFLAHTSSLLSPLALLFKRWYLKWKPIHPSNIVVCNFDSTLMSACKAAISAGTKSTPKAICMFFECFLFNGQPWLLLIWSHMAWIFFQSELKNNTEQYSIGKNQHMFEFKSGNMFWNKTLKYSLRLFITKPLVWKGDTAQDSAKKDQTRQHFSRMSTNHTCTCFSGCH